MVEGKGGGAKNVSHRCLNPLSAALGIVGLACFRREAWKVNSIACCEQKVSVLQ
jgi:hypothetical protein